MVDFVVAYKNAPKFDRSDTKNWGIATSQKRLSWKNSGEKTA